MSMLPVEENKIQYLRLNEQATSFRIVTCPTTYISRFNDTSTIRYRVGIIDRADNDFKWFVYGRYIQIELIKFAHENHFNDFFDIFNFSIQVKRVNNSYHKFFTYNIRFLSPSYLSVQEIRTFGRYICPNI